MIDHLAEQLGGLDVFVNNAGTGGAQLLLDTDYDEWRRVMCTTWTEHSSAFARRPG